MCNTAASETKRIALDIEYDGTNYCGWQAQDNGNTVQQEIERAIACLTGVQVRIHGSGRTDAGVHALGQVAHFDTAASIPPEKFSFALNTHLPDDIRILASYEVDEDFHARFSAKGKHYRYVIRNAPHNSALYRNRCMWVARPLDFDRMRQAAAFMVGEHDFATFCAAHTDVKDTVRRVSDIRLEKKGGYIMIDVWGNGFLRNMVRIMAGTLIAVGLGDIAAEDVPAIIGLKDRGRSGPTADGCGLYLVEVIYE